MINSAVETANANTTRSSSFSLLYSSQGLVWILHSESMSSLEDPQPFNFCSGIWPVVFMRFYWEMELMISSITAKKKLRVTDFKPLLQAFMFFWKNVFFPKGGKKGCPIKYLTVLYHPILQYVKNSPQTWLEFPIYSLEPTRCCCWVRLICIGFCLLGIIVRKSGFHI